MRVRETGILVLTLAVSGFVYGGERIMMRVDRSRDEVLRRDVGPVRGERSSREDWEEWERPDDPVVQDSLNVRRVGRGLFEPFDHIDIGGNLLFLISNNDLVYMDNRDPVRPREVGSYNVKAKIGVVTYDPPYIYCGGADGFRILDASDMDQTVELSVLGEVKCRRIEYRDSYCYVASDTDLVVIDVGDRRNPVVRGRWSAGSGVWPRGTDLVDGKWYVAYGDSGLIELDVSDPDSMIEERFLKGSWWFSKVDVVDTLAYVAVGSGLDRAFGVVDLKRMEVLSYLDFPGAFGTYGLEFQDGYVYVGYEDTGVHVIDVADPLVPRQEGVIDYGYDFSIVDSFLYVTGTDGVRIYDISTPSTPEEVGFVDGDHFLLSVTVRGDYAYVCDYGGIVGGLYIVNIRDAAFPRAESFFPLNGSYDVFVDYPYAYVASATDGFHILDVSDPDSAVEVGYIDMDAQGVFVSYPYAYVALGGLGRDGLQVLDVSRPDSIEELGDYPILATYEVEVKDTIAYVASAFDGVYILNVADPESIEFLSTFPTYDMATDVEVVGDYMYVAAGYAGVSVVDVRDPEHPVELSYSLAGYGNRIDVVEPYLYLAGGSYGLRVLDVSEPDSIYEVGYYGKASMGGICSDGEYIYMGTAGAGFYVFEFTPTGIITDDEDPPKILPMAGALHQNHPNPFNPQTEISFDVGGEPGTVHEVKLSVYDLRGRLVKTLVDGKMEAGRHVVVWDGRIETGNRVASGIYFSTLETESGRFTRKMTALE